MVSIWYLRPWVSPYALCPVSQMFPTCCLSNSSSVVPVDDDPFSPSPPLLGVLTIAVPRHTRLSAKSSYPRLFSQWQRPSQLPLTSCNNVFTVDAARSSINSTRQQYPVWMCMYWCTFGNRKVQFPSGANCDFTTTTSPTVGTP